MKKMIENVGLDVHKNSLSIGIADDASGRAQTKEQLKRYNKFSKEF